MQFSSAATTHSRLRTGRDAEQTENMADQDYDEDDLTAELEAANLEAANNLEVTPHRSVSKGMLTAGFLSRR